MVAARSRACSFKQLLIDNREHIGFITLVSSVIRAKTGINYPDLEPGNKFWNRIQGPSSCYKSLPYTTVSK